jgi:hypothetical protein
MAAESGFGLGRRNEADGLDKAADEREARWPLPTAGMTGAEAAAA